MVMFPGDPGDELHRAVKLALDTGEAPTIEAAYDLFRGYRLSVVVGPNVARSPSLQAAVLTIVNTARRCFLGGVEVVGSLDVPLRVPWRACRTLREAVHDLGGVPANVSRESDPLVVVGDAAVSAGARDFAVRTTFQGWAGGVAPLESGIRLAESQEFTPAGVLAGALAVSEAFQHVRGGNAMAGRRHVGLSLWCPDAAMSWLSDEAVGPELRLLPTRLWLIGLGHLGQAYLWTLGFLPYADASQLDLVLQDFDKLVKANDSTSPLTHPGLITKRKTRAMAEWAEARGFRTAITERRFAADFHLAAEEPTIALCGVDNPQARAALEQVGFGRVIEAGLGKGTNEYLAFQVHTFPGPQAAAEVWSAGRIAAAPEVPRARRLPAYAALGEAGIDDCGLTTLAGRSVGAAFVGTAVSALVIAEVLRELAGGERIGLIDGTLRALQQRSVVATSGATLRNPGFCLSA
jgi:hypothetical protein